MYHVYLTANIIWLFAQSSTFVYDKK